MRINEEVYARVAPHLRIQVNAIKYVHEFTNTWLNHCALVISRQIKFQKSCRKGFRSSDTHINHLLKYMLHSIVYIPLYLLKFKLMGVIV